MKKSIQLLALALVAGLTIGYFGSDAAARITGYLYGDALVIGYPGTTVASISSAGAASVTGLTNTGAFANTGAITNTGSVSVVGPVVASTAAASLQSASLYGAVVTLSTEPTAVGQLWYQVSDNKLYVSTRVPAANVTYCAATGCYAALH